MVIPKPSAAQTNTKQFSTKLHTTVTVNQGGVATIRQDFTITNQTPTTYISQYGLKINSSELQNITVFSDGQQLKPEIVSLPAGQKNGPGQTSIGITFPDKIVGEGKSRQFSIGYVHPDAAMISGSVLEVSLPAQANPDDYDELTVTLVTPAKFGTPVRTTPPNFTSQNNGTTVTTTFTHGSDGIFALYGKNQVFDMQLSYHLENTTNNTGITQLALPPDTAYQRVYYHDLEPKPEKLEVDEDGNWIATYKLPPDSTTDVIANATAYLSLEPNKDFPKSAPTNDLLDSQQYWPVGDQTLMEIVATHATPDSINNYVVDTLEYNTKRAENATIDRLGALETLHTPDMAVCTEYTDLFIALARTAHIPARRATGYAYTQNNELRPLSLEGDVLHAWPEYYDTQQQQWIPIDPTWEDTTGGVDYFNQRDLNHIVFAINGHDSVTPYPAGSYKKEGSEAKTVAVNFGSSFPDVPIAVSYEVVPKKIVGVAIPGFFELRVTNRTGRAWYAVPIELHTATSRLIGTKETGEVSALLPFQTMTVPLRIEQKQGLLPTSDTITVTINHDQQTFTITSGPAFTSLLQKRGVLASLAIGCILLTLITGSVLVLRQQRQRSVRR